MHEDCICDVCGESHDTEDCPHLSIEVKGLQNADCLISRARLTVPHFVEAHEDSDGSIRIIAVETVADKMRLGPFEAPRRDISYCPSHGFILKIFNKDGTQQWLDTQEENNCNWLCLIPTANDDLPMNCMVVQLGIEIYYITTSTIHPGEQLRVWYAPHYAKKLDRPPHPVLGINTLLRHRRQFAGVVNEQHKKMTFDALASYSTPEQQHPKISDPKYERGLSKVLKDIESPRGSYVTHNELTSNVTSFRCSHCRASFGNLQSLAKHTAKHLTGSQQKRRSRTTKIVPIKEPIKEEFSPVESENDDGDDSKDTSFEIKLSANKRQSIIRTRRQAQRDNEQSESIEAVKGSSVESSLKEDKNEAGKQEKVVKITRRKYKKNRSNQHRRENDKFKRESDNSNVLNEPKSIEDSAGVNIEQVKVENAEIVYQDIEHLILDSLPQITRIEMNSEGFKSYTCRLCNNKYQTLDEYLNHLGAHDDVTLCSKCQDVHLDVETHICKTESQTYSCSMCEEMCTNALEHVLHVASHTQAFKCSTCRATFDMNSFKNHVCTKKTEQAASLYCEFCGAEFNNSKYLARHMAVHMGKFICVKCKGHFARKESLMQHRLRCDPEGVKASGEKIFGCQLCPKVFTKLSTFKKHEMKHYEKEIWCLKCKTQFPNQHLKDEHTCLEPGDRSNSKNGKIKKEALFSCKTCGKKFAKEQFLEKHMKIHSSEYTCHICHQNFGRDIQLAKHIIACQAKKAIAEDGEICCQICESRFKDPHAYTLHYQDHSYPYKCEKCSKHFMRLSNLQRHDCHDNEANLYSCEICNKSFKNAIYLQRHVFVHNFTRYPCKQCNNSFSRIDRYNDHVCIDEEGNRVRIKRNATRDDFTNSSSKQKLVCPTCGNTYVSASNLNKHMLTHGEKKESCSICGKMFHLKIQLRLHLRNVHIETRGHICDICGKSYKARTSLTAHNRQYHAATINMYECSGCGKRFRQKGNLKKHMLMHLDEKTFKCTQCDQAFRYPEQLHRHKIWHNDGSKYQCPLCDRSFILSHELNKHIRGFHSERVYGCPYCSTECRHTVSMKRHLQKRHIDQIQWFGDNLDGFVQNLLQLPKTDSVLDTEDQLSENPMIVAEVSNITDTGETTQTVIIETSPGTNPELMNTIQVAAVIDEMQKSGVQSSAKQESQQQTDYTIIGDITDSEGQAVPIAVSGDLSGEGGFIIVPMSQATDSASGMVVGEAIPSDILGSIAVDTPMAVNEDSSMRISSNEMSVDGNALSVDNIVVDIQSINNVKLEHNPMNDDLVMSNVNVDLGNGDLIADD